MHRRQDSRLEGLEVLANELRGEVRDMRNELSEVHGAAIRIESCMLSMAPRLRRLDRERELDREDIRAIRAEQRHSRPDFDPTSAIPDYENLTATGRARAISAEQAKRLIDERDAKAETASLRAQVKAYETREAKSDEWATAWRRALVPILVATIVGGVVTYAVTRMTQPRYKQTTEQK